MALLIGVHGSSHSFQVSFTGAGARAPLPRCAAFGVDVRAVLHYRHTAGFKELAIYIPN